MRFIPGFWMAVFQGAAGITGSVGSPGFKGPPVSLDSIFLL